MTLFEIAADWRLLLSTENGRKGIRGLAPGEEIDRDLSCLDSSRLRGLSADGSLILADVLGESGGNKGSIYMRRTIGTAPVRLGDGGFSVLDLDTGKRTPWREIKPTVPVAEVGNLRITPDGKAYAYNFTYVRSELFVAEGIK